MNFLAHQHLSFFNTEICIGNFSADFLRGKQVDLLSLKIKKGVLLHRKIDAFTDSHPLVDDALKILAKSQGRYASVVLDLYFDFLLANNWEQFSDIPLSDFNKRLYLLFNNKLNEFPLKVQPAVQSLVTHDWFGNYRNEYGIKKALESIKRRTSFENNLDNAYQDMLELREKIEPLFLDFYPELINMSKTFFEEYKITSYF